jgi:hypothetical protein
MKRMDVLCRRQRACNGQQTAEAHHVVNHLLLYRGQHIRFVILKYKVSTTQSSAVCAAAAVQQQDGIKDCTRSMRYEELHSIWWAC